MLGRIRQGKNIEWILFILYTAVYCIVSYCHEPWFDEAQAWLIARDASYWDIMFVLPHYECHPALWHLILSVPAKLGAPFEWGLKAIGLVIAIACSALLLFHSRLPRLMRLSLPFSYFFLYQYGVIVRPYGLMLLIMLLLGRWLPEKSAHPWRVVCLMTLLCLTSAYGIIFAGGIALCMTWELWREKGAKWLFAELLTDARTASLLALLGAAVLILWQIMPRPDTASISFPDRNPFWLCLLCALFTFPGECLLTTASWFNADRSILQLMNIDPIQMGVLCLLGAMLWVFLLCVSSKRNLKYLLTPYLLLVVFAAQVYFGSHHLGVVFILLLFWFELNMADEGRFEIGKAILGGIAKTARDRMLILRAYGVVCAACLLMPVTWTVMACVNEVRYDYYYGRGAARFIRENDLEDLTKLAMWSIQGKKWQNSEGHADYINTNMLYVAPPVNAYYDHNIFYNFNDGASEKTYVIHRYPDYAECKAKGEQWKNAGAPELILGFGDLELVYGDTLSFDDYTMVCMLDMYPVWKSSVREESIPLFVRSDLAEARGLEAEEDARYIDPYTRLAITDEMREAYRNGASVGELINPGLDEIFGKDIIYETEDANYWSRSKWTDGGTGTDS